MVPPAAVRARRAVCDAGRGGGGAGRGAGADSFGGDAGALEPIGRPARKTAEALGGRLFNARTLIRLVGTAAYAASVCERGLADHPCHVCPAADVVGTAGYPRERHRSGGASCRAWRRWAFCSRQHGTLSRKQLRASGLDLPPALLSPWGGVFAELVRIGVACLARWEGGEARYAHREHWLPGPALDHAQRDRGSGGTGAPLFRLLRPGQPGGFRLLAGIDRRDDPERIGRLAGTARAGRRGNQRRPQSVRAGSGFAGA